MTLPSIPDLVLYRTIVDHCYKRAKAADREHKHVYFEVGELVRVQSAAAAEANQELASQVAAYGWTKQSRFLAWLRYDEYRRYLILKKIYPCLVVTDITNYFDSILYPRISETLQGVSDSRLIGLLFFLLERFSIREPYSESPRVGLPVDEFDCSRKLAHMVLFPHDDRMVKAVGEDAYVRWMDDQNIGTSDRAGAMKAIAILSRSLSRLHLSANSGKTRILTISEARRHYHFTTNSRLTELDDLVKSANSTALDNKTIRQGRLLFRKAWTGARALEGHGEWEKVLKRSYRLAGVLRLRSLRRRALADILSCPQIADRVAEYMRVTGNAAELLKFIKQTRESEENVYEDVSLALLESLLRAEPNKSEAAQISAYALELLRAPGPSTFDRHVLPLILLRFGSSSSQRSFLSISKAKESIPRSYLRSLVFVFAGASNRSADLVRQLAEQRLEPELSLVARTLGKLRSMNAVPNRFMPRMRPRWDSVQQSHYVDMRVIVTIRLLRLNKRPAVRTWVSAQISKLKQSAVSPYDKALLARACKKVT